MKMSCACSKALLTPPTHCLISRRRWLQPGRKGFGKVGGMVGSGWAAGEAPRPAIAPDEEAKKYKIVILHSFYAYMAQG